MASESSRTTDFSEEFAHDAAECAARIWKERTAEELQPHETEELVDSIWEFFCLRRVPPEALTVAI